MCLMEALLSMNLDHVLEAIFVLLDVRDLDRCKMVSKSWLRILRRVVWGRTTCRRALWPAFRRQLLANWAEAAPVDTHVFTVTESQAYYRNTQLAADARHVYLALGNALIVFWTRTAVDSERGKIYPWERPLRAKKADSPAPLLAVHPAMLVAAYNHVQEAFVYARVNQHRTLQILSTEGKSVIKVFFLGDVFVMAFKEGIDIYSVLRAINGTESTLEHKFHFTGPSVEGCISAVAGDAQTVLAGCAHTNTIDVYNVESGLLLERVTIDFSPTLLAFSAPHYVLMANASDVRLFSLRTKTFARQWWLLYGSAYRTLVRNIEMDADRVIVATVTADDLFVRKPEVVYTMVPMSALEPLFEVGPTPDLKVVLSYFGQHRRARFPTFKLEADCIVHVDQSGNVVVKSFWFQERKTEKLKDKPKFKSWRPLWRI